MRRLARAREEDERGGSNKSWKRKNAPPIVEEGLEAIRNRKGKKARVAIIRNFTLKPMRTIAPVLRCDPDRLERIRIKERANKEFEVHLSSSSSDPRSVELAEEYRSISSATSTMAKSTATPRSRANEFQTAKQQLKRKDFDKQIQQDIALQASRPAKKMRTSDAKPNHAIRNSWSVGRGLQDQCDTASSSARKHLRIEDDVHQSQRVSEFKIARENPIKMRCSGSCPRGDRNSEPPEGAQLCQFGGPSD